MKKILLLAMFSIAGLANAKSTVELKNVKSTNVSEKKAEKDRVSQLCSITVTFFDSTGLPTGQRLYTSQQNTLSDCQLWQGSVIRGLRQMGFSLN